MFVEKRGRVGDDTESSVMERQVSRTVASRLAVLCLVVTAVISGAFLISAAPAEKAESDIVISQTAAGYDATSGCSVTLSWSGGGPKYKLYYVIGEKEYDITDRLASDTDKGCTAEGLNASSPCVFKVEDYSGNSSEFTAYTVPAINGTPRLNSWFYNLNTAYFTFRLKTGGAANTGYQVSIENKSGKKRLYSASKGSPTASVSFRQSSTAKLKGKIARFRVRGYITLDGKKFYGAWSSPIYFASAKKPKISSHDSKISLTGLKVTGATKKVVYISTKEKSGYKKAATLGAKDTKCAIDKIGKNELTLGKKYYVKVYYYYKVDGKEKKSPIVAKARIGVSKYNVKVGPIEMAQNVE